MINTDPRLSLVMSVNNERTTIGAIGLRVDGFSRLAFSRRRRRHE
jgi:hypothetical protein